MKRYSFDKDRGVVVDAEGYYIVANDSAVKAIDAIIEYIDKNIKYHKEHYKHIMNEVPCMYDFNKHHTLADGTSISDSHLQDKIEEQKQFIIYKYRTAHEYYAAYENKGMALSWNKAAHHDKTFYHDSSINFIKTVMELQPKLPDIKYTYYEVEAVKRQAYSHGEYIRFDYKDVIKSIKEQVKTIKDMDKVHE